MKARYYYFLAVTGYLCLFTLLMLWNTIISPAQKLPVAFTLIITVSPLLLVMRGFLAGNIKSCSWMAFLSLPYFIHGSIETYSRSQWVLPALEVLFSLMLFFGTTLYISQARKNL